MMRNQRGVSIIEVMGGLAIICMIALASSAISLQVLKTSKKSKTVSLGIALETALLEAVENPEQPGYKAATVGFAITDRLRAGSPPDEIQLWSNFGSDETEMSSRRLLYRLRLSPSEPEELFIDAKGRATTPTGPWVLKVRAAYKQILAGADSLPQYAVAYSISSSADVNFKSFGSSSATFADSDFFFPVAQNVYSGNGNSYSTERPGACRVIDPRQIISLYSVDMQTGDTRCVVKGNECGSREISTGVELNIPENGNLSMDLKCLPIKKCSCKEIDPKNWVITSFKPSALLAPAGETCGTCEFVFKSPVPAQGVPTTPARTNIDFSVCPHEKYDVSDVVCESEVVNSEFIGPSVTPPATNPCLTSPNPNGQVERFSGSAAPGSGKARCSRANESNVCWRWSYNVKIVSGSCVLQAQFQGQKPAKSVGGP